MKRVFATQPSESVLNNWLCAASLLSLLPQLHIETRKDVTIFHELLTKPFLDSFDRCLTHTEVSANLPNGPSGKEPFRDLHSPCHHHLLSLREEDKEKLRILLSYDLPKSFQKLFFEFLLTNLRQFPWTHLSHTPQCSTNVPIH